jgi:hypothetical protein
MRGAIGLAIVTSVLNSFVHSRLSNFLSADQVDSLLQTSVAMNSLQPEQQVRVRTIFGQEYDVQMRILIELAAAQLSESLLMWQKNQIVV